ncbi:D-amino-acid transaminase [Bacillus tianshenii]|nr:D-amino-acid transaminase [Bacillus tianshenii]
MSVGFVNGKFIDIDEKVLPIDERGHQFGDGVYEVIRVYHGRMFAAKQHLERLERSTKAIKIALPYPIEEIKEIIEEGIERSGYLDAEVYLQVTRGIVQRQHLFPDVAPSLTMTVRPARQIPQEKRDNGVSAILLEDERWANCYIKSLNLLPNILAKQTAFEQEAMEAILHRDGIITEGSSSNIFIVVEGKLITPPLSRHILAGITREVVLELAKKLEIPVVEKQISLEEFKESDEIFFTSTSAEVMPVIELDGKAVGDGKPGKTTVQLQKAYRQLYMK